MAPGPTFERVYRALKAELRSGRFAPGERLEPAALSDDLNASVTPIRDALHRLAGENLVEAPRQDGFRAPLVTEVGLRHLYGWNMDLLTCALRTQSRAAGPDRPELAGWRAAEGDDAAVGMESLFLAMGGRSGNPEHTLAISNVNDRLHWVRRLEVQLFADAAAEFAELVELFRSGDLAQLRRRLLTYHRRRQRAAPTLLERLYAGTA